MPQLIRVHTGPEPPRVRAEVHHAEPLAVAVEPQIPEDRECQVAGPRAVRHQHGSSAEDRLRRAPLEARVPDFVLLGEQVAAVEVHPIGNAAALEYPAGRVARRLHVAAMDETDVVLAGEAGRATRPEQQSRQRLRGAPADGETIHRAVELRVHVGGVGLLRGGDDQLPGGIAAGELTVQAGDAAAQRREVVREEQRRHGRPCDAGRHAV